MPEERRQEKQYVLGDSQCEGTILTANPDDHHIETTERRSINGPLVLQIRL